MSHYRMLDRDPSAIITVGGSEKKIYQGGQIFINDGDNFEIRFFNPLQEKIGVEILFNGQKKNDGLLVMKPGEDVILDRFLGEKKKMKYETYTIDGGNDAAVKAAALNGLVEFKFYKEKNTFFTTTGNCYYSATLNSTGGTGGLPHFTSTSTSNLNSRNYDLKNTRSYTGLKNPGVYCCDMDLSQTKSDKGIDCSDYLAENLDKGINYSDYVAENLDKNISYCEYTAESTPELNVKGKINKSKATQKWDPIVETGRIEKGPESNQNLTTVDTEFESTPFHIITYQLKPNSQRPTEITEVRNYCTGCGYRVRKSSWTFCPKCGERL